MLAYVMQQSVNLGLMGCSIMDGGKAQAELCLMVTESTLEKRENDRYSVLGLYPYKGENNKHK